MLGGRKVLRSWKDIAVHLHRTDRTCQRWEREFGLPVHREDDAPKASVYAYTDELDAWLSRKFHEPEIDEDQLSIAVLPFVELESQSFIEHFADGLAAALIEVLSGFQNLRVCALTSVLSLQGEKMDVREIGQRLRVNSVLEGCLQIRGKAIELAASLVNARDGFTIWAQRYAGQVDNLAPIEDDIVANIIRTMRLRSRHGEHPSAVGSSKRNPEAFRLFSRGRYHWQKMTEKDLERSVIAFQEALKLDDGFARAHAALSDSYIHLAFLGYRPPKEVFPKAKAAALNALALNGALPEALMNLAMIEWCHEYYPAEADKHFRRALDLDPNGGEGRAWYGNFLIARGQWDDGMAELEEALECDPPSLMVNCLVAHGYYLGSDLVSAERQAQHCLALDEKSAWARQTMGRIYLARGNFKAAREEFQHAVSPAEKSPQFLVCLACAQGLAGKADDARRLLKQVLCASKQRYVDVTGIAEIFASLSEYDKAIRWLETALRNRAVRLIWIKCNPLFQKIQKNPRFMTLAGKIGLVR